MLVAILTVIALFIFVQVISFISWRDMKRRRKSYIRGKFGGFRKRGSGMRTGGISAICILRRSAWMTLHGMTCP